MFKVKRLYVFMLKTFLPLFMMTFFICLFIVIMQFLWKYIDELVGKGLSVDLIAELFFYAALSMVPLALPLSILLASLMTFGNLGEHFELTAMKSSGISLLKVMKPLAIFVALVSVGAFFFQNDVLPPSQVKMWTLLFSMRQKSPTLDIPEGAIYSQIPGYNLYVKQKNPHNDKLYGLLIYDVSKSMAYPRIVAADSGSLRMNDKKTHLILTLEHGNWYEELAQSTTMSNELGNEMYRREAFKFKEIVIPYDDNFTRMNDETMKQQYIGKNITELRHSIDSVQHRLDSAGTLAGNELRLYPSVGVPTARIKYNANSTPNRNVTTRSKIIPDASGYTNPRATRDTNGNANFMATRDTNGNVNPRVIRDANGNINPTVNSNVNDSNQHDASNQALNLVRVRGVKMNREVNFDSIISSLSASSRSNLLTSAISRLKMSKQSYEFKSFSTEEDSLVQRRHEIELQKKFTLSLACLIFFFIGAPLGAIIRKGGLGTPIVISVLLFIVYYIIDNMGYKLARDGRWLVWQGIWLSSAVLLPLGVFLTKKAIDDSAVFNADAYRNFFRRLLGLHQTRHLTLKEVVIEEMVPQVALEKIALLKRHCAEFLDKYKARQSYVTYLKEGYDKTMLNELKDEMEQVVDYLSNSRNQLLLNKAMDFPILRQLLTYHVTNYKQVGTALAVIFPVGLPLYLVGVRHQSNLKKELRTSLHVCDEITAIIQKDLNEKTNTSENTQQDINEDK